ncbi:MAG: hypothetical protein SOI44_00990 [Lactimicrobium sp.]|jgi:flagellar biosynthesis/type III secretory pathway protein FliH|uniref:hypothetical protein n=1 Tax=Lactimicrobium sp. TaxID=2563780 RepID=UPI002F35E021
MCNYSDLVYEDGIKKGKAEGRAEGKVEGAREHSLQTAEKMIKDAILPDKMIARYSGLSLDEVHQLRNDHLVQ